ncbi:serine/threonine protein kinase [Ktedonospora formicarum]|uniref:non-specific serine/threonine protein kinase n=1 Tax=Ktedonospora formicarum TaxID=2778364 RepID=A0A8J3I633_9CHLR|nr:serine/threonine-protein kinase [Ktedonospora formicarum]GHO47768.1 hypothetical protein KSX_59310 [Ktedonospora formicarum]
MQFLGLEIGHYQLTQLIGSGGMGEVYLAEDLHLSRQVAIKLLRMDLLATTDTHNLQEMLHLFQHEAQAISRLSHPHILPLYEYNEQDVQGTRISYMVMPFCSQGSLEQWLLRRHHPLPLPLSEALPLLRQAADALQYAHDHHILHRDIKPQNFLLSEQGSASHPHLMLTDFGTATVMNAPTTSGTVVRGTPAYMPPEQWTQRATYASDQYALAVMSYYLLTGHMPFPHTSNLGVLMNQHIHQQPASPSTLIPSLPEYIVSAILKALAKDPEQRFHCVSDFVKALEGASPDDVIQSSQALIVPSVPPPPTPSPTTYQQPASSQTLHSTDTLASPHPLLTPVRTLPPAPLGVPFPIPGRPFPPPNTSTSRRKTWTIVITLLILVPFLCCAIPSLIFTSLHLDSDVTNAPTTTTHTETQVPTTTTRTRSGQAGPGDAQQTATAEVQQTATAIVAPTATALAQAQATAVSHISLTDATQNAPEYSDTLNDPNQGNTSSKGWVQDNWCQFHEDGYHVTQDDEHNQHACVASRTSYTNSTISVDMRILRGHSGGIFVRFQDNGGVYGGYLFEISSAGEFKISSVDWQANALIDWTASSAIKMGGKNTLAVITCGHHFKFYVNNIFLGQTSDDNNSYTSSSPIALAALADNSPTEITFSNLKMYSSICPPITQKNV